MSSLGGTGNWELNLRKDSDGWSVLRARTCEEEAVLPEVIQGIPVTEIGHHAFSPTADPVEGETVRLGFQTAKERDNRNLKKLSLPSTVQSIGNYAFLNCRNLEELCLTDSIDSFGASVFMNCRSFQRIHLMQGEQQKDTLALLVEELQNKLEVVITETDGFEYRLIFPEYTELYEENAPAHHFDYNIYGAGYPYHHIFQKKRLALSDYDSLWSRYLKTEHDISTAIALAWNRVRYPKDLSGSAGEAYEQWLCAHWLAAAKRVLTNRDAEGLRLLLQMKKPESEELSQAENLSRSLAFTEASAILLEQSHRLGVEKPRKKYDL